MASWPPIDRDDLKQAAGRPGFDTVLPHLVRRLISETARGLTELDMPGGAGTAAGGFDGVVAATEDTAFVPAGLSVWELSVIQSAQTKATGDYDKRTSGPDGRSPAEVTYVQAILAPWRKARTWAAERTKDGRWRQVRAYNLESLDTWLESAPGTTAWLAGQLGKTLPGVLSVDSWWDDVWLPSTDPPLTAGIVLAGREAASSALLALLAGGTTSVTLGGDLRIDELKAVVAGSFSGAPGVDSMALRARALFVDDRHSLEQLLRQTQPLVLVLGDTALIADLPLRHPHQLVLLHQVGGRPDITLPSVDEQVVQQHLEAGGMAWERARRVSVLARRSLSALRRALAVHPATLIPSWATAPDVVCRRLLLVGAWDGTRDDDRQAVEECVGHPYAAVSEAALRLVAVPPLPFLGQVEERWHLLDPEDAWSLLGPHLNLDDLEAIRVTALRVLSERDPFIALDSAGRIREQLAGTRRTYSSTLRHGLARSLALLGSSDSAVRLPGGTTGSGWARQVVRELLSRANAGSGHLLWTSLGGLLRLLAEAAPDEFLRALRDGLEEGSPLRANIFTDAESDEFGTPRSSPHIHVLSALELLAWSPDHFDEVVDILAELAALDPGGGWSNRPHASLATIFSCWRPNTSVSEPHRRRALARLLRLHPVVARKLLRALIPRGRAVQTAHLGPSFRRWQQEQVITRSEVVGAVSAVVDLLLEDLEDVPERYLALIDKIDLVPPSRRATFGRRLTALGPSIGDDGTRARLFEALRDKVAHHREYADAGWALPDDELRPLEDAARAVEPHSPLLRTRWLFASDWPTSGDRLRRDDFDAYEAALAERRAVAVGQVLAEGGLPAVAKLASGTPHAHVVGVALAGHTSDLDADMVGWLSEDGPGRRPVAFSYLASRLRAEGVALLDRLLALSAEPAVQADLLRAAGDPPTAWAKLATLPTPVAEHYWKEFVYFGLGPAFEHVLKAAEGLMSVRRHAAAVHLITLYERRPGAQDPAAAAAAAATAATACKGLLAQGFDDPELLRLGTYEFERVVDLLGRHRDTVGRRRVLQLEWQLFPTLGFDADAPTLHQALAEDPGFFAELVAHAYRPDDPNGEEEDTEERRATARRADEVLRSWHRCPGTGAADVVSLPDLRAWVTDARDRLAKACRSRAGDLEIGRILSCAPPDPDSLLPPRAVRDLLEELRNDRIENELLTGLLNQRGVSSRGLSDGGEQEWELADSCRRRARTSEEWPRTRRLLLRLAEHYERDARTEDEEAERHRRGLDR